MLAVLDCRDKSVEHDRANLTRAVISTVRSYVPDDTVINDSRLSLLLKYLSIVSRHPTRDFSIFEETDQRYHLDATSELAKLVVSDEYVRPLEVRELPQVDPVNKEIQNLVQSLVISREDAVIAIRLSKGMQTYFFFFEGGGGGGGAQPGLFLGCCAPKKTEHQKKKIF